AVPDAVHVARTGDRAVLHPHDASGIGARTAGWLGQTVRTEHELDAGEIPPVEDALEAPLIEHHRAHRVRIGAQHLLASRESVLLQDVRRDVGAHLRADRIGVERRHAFELAVEIENARVHHLAVHHALDEMTGECPGQRLHEILRRRELRIHLVTEQAVSVEGVFAANRLFFGVEGFCAFGCRWWRGLRVNRWRRPQDRRGQQQTDDTDKPELLKPYLHGTDFFDETKAICESTLISEGSSESPEG